MNGAGCKAGRLDRQHKTMNGDWFTSAVTPLRRREWALLACALLLVLAYAGIAEPEARHGPSIKSHSFAYDTATSAGTAGCVVKGASAADLETSSAEGAGAGPRPAIMRRVATLSAIEPVRRKVRGQRDRPAPEPVPLLAEDDDEIRRSTAAAEWRARAEPLLPRAPRSFDSQAPPRWTA